MIEEPSPNAEGAAATSGVEAGPPGEGPNTNSFPYEHQGSFFILMNQLAPVTECWEASVDTSGMMVLVNACQKTVHGAEWMQRHGELFREAGMGVRTSGGGGYFLFGSGPRIRSTSTKEIPAGIGGVAAIVRSAEVDTHIPLLASRHLMPELGTILDLVEFKAYFTKIGVTVPLVKLANSHLAVSMMTWPAGGFPRGADTWGAPPGRNLHDEVWLDPSEKENATRSASRPAVVHLPDADPSASART